MHQEERIDVRMNNRADVLAKQGAEVSEQEATPLEHNRDRGGSPHTSAEMAAPLAEGAHHGRGTLTCSLEASTQYSRTVRCTDGISSRVFLTGVM